jgi:hypothetical protein
MRLEGNESKLNENKALDGIRIRMMLESSALLPRWITVREFPNVVSTGMSNAAINALAT